MSTSLYGTSYAQDGSDQLLLGHLQIFNGQLLAWLRSLAGVSPVPGLPNPIDTEAGSTLLDEYLHNPELPMRMTTRHLSIALLAVLATLAMPAGRRPYRRTRPPRCATRSRRSTRADIQLRRVQPAAERRSSGARPPTCSPPPSPNEAGRCSARAAARAR